VTPNVKVTVPGTGGSPGHRLDITVTTKPKLSYKKVVVSGNLIEEYRYETPLLIGRGGTPRKRVWRPNDIDEIEEMAQRAEEYGRRSATRAKSNIRRLISANITPNMKFVTLTFANTDDLNITDPKSTYFVYKNFMRRLFLKYGKRVFVTVPELQKRGAVHYHLLIDLPYIKNDELAELWRYGFIKIKKVHDPEKAPWYLAKYFTKANIFELNHRRYYTSVGLVRPKVLLGNKVEYLITKLNNDGVKAIPRGSYPSQFNGVVQIYEYNLPQAPALKETM